MGSRILLPLNVFPKRNGDEADSGNCRGEPARAYSGELCSGQLMLSQRVPLARFTVWSVGVGIVVGVPLAAAAMVLYGIAVVRELRRYGEL